VEPRQQIPRFLVVALLGAGAVLGGAAVELWRGARPTTSATQAPPATAQADIDRLKSLVPTQSHAMADVGDHYANLWFAAEQGNWPLADFYLTETRQQIQWTVLIRPIRKDLEDKDVDLKPIFNAIDASAFATLKLAIAQKDKTKFENAYKQGLDACYSCHKASAKPFLKPIMPREPAQNILDFAPDAASGKS
jgi:hypothetical protein